MILRFASDLIINRFRKSLIVILLFVISITLIIFSTIINFGHNYAYDSADSLLKQGVKNTAVLRLSDNNIDYLEELASQPEVETLGSSYKFEIDCIPELYEIQRSHKTNNDMFIEVICVNLNSSNLCDLKLKSGDMPEKLNFDKQDNKNTEYLYLGAEYENIPIGTIYDTEYCNYIVAGILDDSQRWIDQSLLYGFDINTVDFTFDCSYSIHSVSAGLPFTSDIWICASDNYTIEQTIEKALNLTEKHNINVTYTTLQSSYERATSDWITINSILSKLIIIVCFSCIMMMICFQLIQILTDKREMGIMMSVGFSISDIWIIMLVKNLIISVISLIAIIPLSVYVIKWWFNVEGMKNVAFSILINKAFPLAILAIVGILVILSIIILGILKKLTPLDMIGGQHD